jgi:hypothetical protein
LRLARRSRAVIDALEGENLYQHAEHYFRTMRAGVALEPDDKAAAR